MILLTATTTTTTTTLFLLLIQHCVIEPFGYDVPLLTILQLPRFIIWGYISFTWLIVLQDIVLASTGNWTFVWWCFCLAIRVVEGGGRDDSSLVLGEGVRFYFLL
jgi:hypothetical protein